jgi:hypothetical protein
VDAIQDFEDFLERPDDQLALGVGQSRRRRRDRRHPVEQRVAPLAVDHRVPEGERHGAAGPREEKQVDEAFRKKS